MRQDLGRARIAHQGGGWLVGDWLEGGPGYVPPGLFYRQGSL